MILIRADANEKIGTGHVMRCLSIARAFAHLDQKVIFITADHRGDTLIQQNGFETICLDTDWTHMDYEVDGLLKIINNTSPDILLVDSYFVTMNYFSALAGKVKVAYIDDMNYAQWNVDVIINYNIFSQIYDYSWYEENKIKLILGPKYAPLRDEFQDKKAHKIDDIVSSVMVSAGGTDPERIIERIMIEICPILPEIKFHFIVGALNPRINSIKETAHKNSNVVLHVNEQNMAELMEECDIAISAAGTTLYELCACGIPTITYILADNQIVAAEQFHKQGVMLNAGDCRDNIDFIDMLAYQLKELCIDKITRKRLSTTMQLLVDGLGAERIVESLL